MTTFIWGILLHIHYFHSAVTLMLPNPSPASLQDTFQPWETRIALYRVKLVIFHVCNSFNHAVIWKGLVSAPAIAVLCSPPGM